MIIKKEDDLVIRIEISANGIKRFYIEDEDLKAQEKHLYQDGHIKANSGEDFSQFPYSSATYGSLYKDELIKIAGKKVEIIEVDEREKILLIKIIFNMFINKWGHPDVPYQI